MCHVRKLYLSGNICGRDQKVSSSYSWPLGEKQSAVEEMIKSYRRAFCNVTVVIQHTFPDL
jgi:hypothetical protein